MKKTISIFISLTIIVFQLTGCNLVTPPKNNTTVSTDTVVLTGYSRGNCIYSYSGETTTKIISDTIVSEGTLSAIAIDGSPCLSHDEFTFALADSEKNANTSYIRNKQEKTLLSLQAFLTSDRANDPETDILESIKLAARILSNKNGKKNIIISSNGISTCGILNYANNLICASTSTIISLLKTGNNIPDLSNVHVFWLGMGDCSDPQNTPSQLVVDKISDIWRAVLEAGGASVEFSSEVSLAKISDDTLPTVTPVVFPYEIPVEFPVDESIDLKDRTILLNNTTLSFQPNSSEFSNKDESFELINDFAPKILKGNQVVTIFGGVAGDNNSAFAIKLSQARADKVKELLLECGVPDENIKAIGKGCNDAWHIYGGNTNLDDEIAAQNRHIVLVFN